MMMTVFLLLLAACHLQEDVTLFRSIHRQHMGRITGWFPTALLSESSDFLPELRSVVYRFEPVANRGRTTVKTPLAIARQFGVKL